LDGGQHEQFIRWLSGKKIWRADCCRSRAEDGIDNDFAAAAADWLIELVSSTETTVRIGSGRRFLVCYAWLLAADCVRQLRTSTACSQRLARARLNEGDGRSFKIFLKNDLKCLHVDKKDNYFLVIKNK